MTVPPGRREVYEQILRLIATAEGWVLVPVEVAAEATALELAAWLGAHAHPVRLVHAGGDLVERLLAGEGAVLVVGGEAADADALRRLNLRRDTVRARVDAPLLWCGPAAFHAAVRLAAPDFWSTRALPRRIPAAGAGGIPTAPRWSGPLVREGPAELAAARRRSRRAGDAAEAARLAYLRAGALAARGQWLAARAAVADGRGDLVGQDSELRFDLELLDARLARLLRDPEDAHAALARARAVAGASPGRQAQVALVEAAALEDAGDLAAARDRLGVALARCGDERSLLAARTLVALGRLERRLGRPERAAATLLRAVAAFQAQGEALGEANALVELAELHDAQGRPEEARALFASARERYREHGVPEAAARLDARLGDG